MAPHTFTIQNRWALGDTVCLSALVRDIHRAHPGQYRLEMIGHYPSFWQNNPHVSVPKQPHGQLIKLDYREGIREAGRGTRVHFLSWFHRDFGKTGITVPVTEPKGEIYLSADEKRPAYRGRYWVVVAGGKKDMTAKVWHASRWQQVVDTLAHYGVKCLQAGCRFARDYHPELRNCDSAVDKTRSIRDFFSLIYNAEGVICGVTAAMHIAAVFDKPCVVVAGGREEPWWEGYFRGPHFGPSCAAVKVPHKFLHTVGLLDCGGNLTRGCWKDRTVPIERADFHNARRKNQLCRQPVRTGTHPVPACLDMIEADHVVEAVMQYYEDGTLPPIQTPQRRYPLPTAAITPTIASAGRLEEPPSAPVTPNFEALAAFYAQNPPSTPGYPVELQPATAVAPELVGMDHPYVAGKFTVCVLGYGNHTELLKRCLDSIVTTIPAHRLDLRVALNQPCHSMLDYVRGYGSSITKVYTDTAERKKYPAMRAMFWDTDCPITTPYVCWFDDDSWCREKDWAAQLARCIADNHGQGCRLYGTRFIHDLMGYKKHGKNPEKWFQAADWWRSEWMHSAQGQRKAPNGAQIVFASGGFWALAVEAIRKANIPDVRLNHNGGDITIGEQVNQAGFKVKDFSRNKRPICWSDAPRRGFREPFPWAEVV